MENRELVLTPNRAGFLVNWMISGPVETSYHTEHFNPNQLAFEKEIRERIADEVPDTMDASAFSWEYDPSFGNWFVDRSKFYFLLTKVELFGTTILCLPAAGKMKARLWTYGAATVWVNGKVAASVTEPVYKPIRYVDFELDLLAGENEILVRLQNLGVRDTRNIFGIQLKENFDQVRIKTREFEKVCPLIAAEQKLSEVRLRNHQLYLAGGPTTPISVNGELLWEQGERVSLKEGTVKCELITEVNGMKISRRLEDRSADLPVKHTEKDPAMHRREWYRQLKENCKDSHSFTMALVHLLESGKLEERDYERIRYALPQIDSRKDCADFTLHDLLRVVLGAKGGIPAELMEEIKTVVLRFRYWMDEKGSDGMCFWSENHAITFYACQLMAGLVFPDDVFIRSGRTGREQNILANHRCREWLDSIEESAFEEFLSPGYMVVTLETLLGVIEYAEPDVSERAWKVADQLLEMIFMHLFDHAIIGPFGRIYGEVVVPYKPAVLSALSYFDPRIPVGSPITQMVVPLYELSRYEMPAHLKELADAEIHQVYETGNAQVHLCKTSHYILTSVASERSEFFTGGWSYEEAMKEDPYVTGNFSFRYVKALNERFHGTTLFEPGVYGYQQHMWSAALSGSALVFVNHPGDTHHTSSMRPGYWYGNGLMPALRQWDNVLLAVYHLNEKHPVSFTHTFFPKESFEEIREEGSWIFGRVAQGYLGLWSSCELVPYHDVLTDCELRAYEKEQGYVCICSDEEAEGSFEAFCEKCLAKEIRFVKETLTLCDGEGHELTFVEKYNDTQVI